jgi:hypothetical protein
MKRALLIAVAVAIGWYGNAYRSKHQQGEALFDVAWSKSAGSGAGSFTCDGRTYCSHMTVAKQRPAGHRVDLGAGGMVVEQRAGEGWLGALLVGDPLLLGRQQLMAKPAPEALLVAVVACVAARS